MRRAYYACMATVTVTIALGLMFVSGWKLGHGEWVDAAALWGCAWALKSESREYATRLGWWDPATLRNKP